MLLYIDLNRTGLVQLSLIYCYRYHRVFFNKRRVLKRKIKVHAVMTDYYLWVTRTLRYLLYQRLWGSDGNSFSSDQIILSMIAISALNNFCNQEFVECRTCSARRYERYRFYIQIRRIRGNEGRGWNSLEVGIYKPVFAHLKANVSS